ncbi:hypothetical protein B4109_0497 [Geobacillus stearothermophilus]|uniref:Uncharacterized protein n=1 Tax=Geobacillus stearothermophilus TaxID=1422 RepID=A0A150MJQ9_GEOSE|nr:hypothetical protein B4109_0497 [Geobacillus stearothermophilus]
MPSLSKKKNPLFSAARGSNELLALFFAEKCFHRMEHI